MGKPKQVAEYDAEGEVERVYHEIRQSLRVSGVNLNFRTWAGFGKFLPLMWDSIRPNIETLAFEEAADRLRAEAIEHAAKFGESAPSHKNLGPSQTYQIQKALDLYHYINPKLLIMTSAVRSALVGEAVGDGTAGEKEMLPERGVPAGMYPMEMVEEEPDDERIKAIFSDIKKTLSLQSINSDYRTLALWPDYLEPAWKRLKPITTTQEFRRASEDLRETSRRYARALPYKLALSARDVKGVGEDPDEIVEITSKFETLLPGLILNICRLALEWRPASNLVKSPFPPAALVAPRAERGGV